MQFMVATDTRRHGIALLSLWLVVTSFNLTKAVHIDDTVHLTIAKQILANPWRPMSGSIAWGKTGLEPVHALNQPHLFMYLLAGGIALFGEREFWLHALVSLFSLAAIVSFYLLARHYHPANAIWTTASFCLGPVFMPAQNLMTDIPLTAFFLTTVWCLERASGTIASPRYWIAAGILAGCASLTKYTGLVVIPLLGIVAIAQRRARYLVPCWTASAKNNEKIVRRPEPQFGMRRAAFEPGRKGSANSFRLATRSPSSLTSERELQRCGGRACREPGFSSAVYLWAMGIPLLMLAAWSGFNYWEYGGIHILERSTPAIRFGERGTAWILCLGAISPFPVAAVPYMFASRRRRITILLLLGGALWFAQRSFMGYLAEPSGNSVLRILFFVNGTLLLGVVGMVIAKRWRSGKSIWLSLPVLWFCGAAVFTVLFPPFIAARHYLIVLPAILLLIAPVIAKRWCAIGAGLTAILGVSLSLSDWSYADVYRQQAKSIPQSLPKEHGTIWYVGHWGWQWYADRNRMVAYEPGSSRFLDGDYLVIPEAVHKQPVAKPDHVRFAPVQTIVAAAPPFAICRSMEWGYGLYRSNIQYLPWTISTQPLERFRVVRIEIER